MTEDGQTYPFDGLALDEDEVRLTAYFLWEEAGKPFGEADYYWWLALEKVARRRAADCLLARAPTSREAPAFPDGKRPGPKEAAIQAREAGTEAMRDKPKERTDGAGRGFGRVLTPGERSSGRKQI